MRAPLPIDPYLDEIRSLVGRHRAAVVIAPPGAGKTTRVPPLLAENGPLILLQPRRVAARALARRIADENAWTLGEEAGWHIRFERRFSPRTRVLVATEGILTARLQSDPLLGGFRTIVLDEFHERTIHADLALALAREAWRARSDLRLVVMSATLDALPVAAYLGGAPIVRVPGRPFPVAVEYQPRRAPEDAVASAWGTGRGHVLVFLPGAPEIRALAERLSRRADVAGARVLPLHGVLDAEAQDAAVAPSQDRKIVLATNIAETSLTIEGVEAVVDTGFQKILRLDPATGLDRLEVERVSRDAAEQRAGRAGRTGPGRAIRLWDARDALREHREPEIDRVDLAAPLLEVLASGADARTFGWFTPPPAERLEAGLRLLERLGAAAAGRITPLGDLLRRLPTSPRLARLLVAAEGSSLAAAACAVLGDRWTPRGPLPAGASDVLGRADLLRDAPRSVRRAAEEIHAAARRLLSDPELARAAAAARVAGGDEEDTVLRALLAAFPDRLARRREPGSARLVLASGHGGVLARDSAVRDGELLLALDVEAGARGPGSEALVRVASRVERAWLPPAAVRVEHRYDAATRAVRAVEVESIDGLVLAERPVAPDPAVAGRLLADELLASGAILADRALGNRLRFAGVEIDPRAIAEAACAGRTTLPEVDPVAHLPRETRAILDRIAPATLRLPSGREAPLDYRDDGSVVVSARMQEMFGRAETWHLGARGEPVVVALLAPNGRPVQTTRDLSGFWERAYPELRRQLRARYPKHAWPEDPRAAAAKRR